MRIPKRIKGKPTAAHRRSQGQEEELAKRVGGRQPRGSGSGAEKGDVRLKGIVRIEAKTTSRKSFSVTREMIEKIEDAALPSGELPAIVVEFLDSKGKPSHEVAVVPVYVLDILTSK